VEAVLDAVMRIVKRDGIKAVTTNRVAEVAGASIGSVYHYFSDKRAIFATARKIKPKNCSHKTSAYMNRLKHDQ